MASRACAVGAAARTYSSPFRARDGDYARRAERERAAQTAARLREEVFEPVGHAQWVFTVPKMLRPYFLRHRDLLGDLCRAAWQSVREMMVAAAGETIRPGMVAVVQTFGSNINFHPHVHAIVRRGGWTKAGQWVAVPWVDPKAVELLFRHKVLSLLRQAGLIGEPRIALLLSWKHTGFSVHNSVTIQPQDAGATERLVRYLMRAPVSQERLEINPELAEVRLRSKPGADDQRPEDEVQRLDPDEVVARIIAQIPEPRQTPDSQLWTLCERRPRQARARCGCAKRITGGDRRGDRVGGE